MRAVPVSELSAVWPRVQGWIAEAVAYNAGDEGILDVLIALAREAYTLWEAPDFAAVTQLQRHPKQSVWVVLYAGGEGEGASQKAYEFARQYARMHGIDVIRIFGRPGWEKVLGLEEVGRILQVKVQ